jgi:hypothetical protein
LKAIVSMNSHLKEGAPPEVLMLSRTDPAPVNPADVEEAMPLPTDPKVIYLGGLFLLGLAAALYAAAEIVWPLVFAFMSLFCLSRCREYWRGFRFPGSFLRCWSF